VCVLPPPFSLLCWTVLSLPASAAKAAIRDGATAAVPWVRVGLSEAARAAGIAYDKAGNVVTVAGVVLAKAGGDAARFAQRARVAAQEGGSFAVKEAKALVAAGSPYVMRGLSEAQQAAGAAVDEAGNVVDQAGTVIAKVRRAASEVVLLTGGASVFDETTLVSCRLCCKLGVHCVVPLVVFFFVFFLCVRCVCVPCTSLTHPLRVTRVVGFRLSRPARTLQSLRILGQWQPLMAVGMLPKKRRRW